jgi:polyhydroxybutyrate depolymerase
MNAGRSDPAGTTTTSSSVGAADSAPIPDQPDRTLATPRPAPTSPPPPTCTLDTTNGTITRTLGQRVYQLHVPPGLVGAQVPLLVSLHGDGGNGFADEQATGWSPFAGTHNFIVAYPDARGYPHGSWYLYSSPSADVAFVRQVVEDISAHWCINPNALYVDGWSSGAILSQQIACDAADLFTAATSYDGISPTEAGSAPCQPARPISVGLFVGLMDEATSGALAPNTAAWERYDNCSPTPTHEVDEWGFSDTYSCSGGTQLVARHVTYTKHAWPYGGRGDDQRQRMWSLYQARRVWPGIQ